MAERKGFELAMNSQADLLKTRERVRRELARDPIHLSLKAGGDGFSRAVDRCAGAGVRPVVDVCTVQAYI